MPHALITGGAGFIGSHLTDYLLARDYQVTIIDNLATGRLENIEHNQSNRNLRVAIEDIRNIHTTDRFVSECDVIFHMAAAVGVQKIIEEPINTIETNIGGTEVLLKAARRYRKKIMIANTFTINF
ncbi:MAG: GDP-mannose 4,6-dehydratase [Chloroflexota bacterium]